MLTILGKSGQSWLFFGRPVLYGTVGRPPKAQDETVFTARIAMSADFLYCSWSALLRTMVAHNLSSVLPKRDLRSRVVFYYCVSNSLLSHWVYTIRDLTCALPELFLSRDWCFCLFWHYNPVTLYFFIYVTQVSPFLLERIGALQPQLTQIPHDLPMYTMYCDYVNCAL